ncbi:MAG: hypothetical protein JNM84_15020 [Planctomycetes bacterium]|nr:hypothetical protein [Planctomycetota bacterium]
MRGNAAPPFVLTAFALALASGCAPSDPPQPTVDPRAATPRVMFDARTAALLQRLDPLPAGEAEKVVLAVRGVPIRRGDFDRILDFWLPTVDPETALQPLLEGALMNELLPRALALAATPVADLETLASTLENARGSDGRYDLAALVRALDPLSAAAGNADEIFELQLERKRNAQPFLAALGPRLARVGDQTGPVVTRDGIFVFERVDASGTGPQPANPSTPSAGALWVRAAACLWRLRDAASLSAEPLRGPALREHLDAAARAAVNGKEVQVLDPAYADAVPRWIK